MQSRQTKSTYSVRARASKVLKKVAISATSLLAITLLGSFMASASTFAAANPNGTAVTDRFNVLRVYVKAGETLDVQFTKVVKASSSNTITGSVASVFKPGDGESPSLSCTITRADVAGTDCGTTLTGMSSSQDGIWKINLAANSLGEYPSAPGSAGLDNFTWSAVVKSGSTVKKGRVWTEKYNMRQAWPSETTAYAAAPFNGENSDIDFWWVSEEGYQYNVKYNDFNGIYSTFFANPYGLVHSGTCTPVYQSKDGSDVGDGLPIRGLTDSVDNCGGRYKMFFEAPASDLPEEASDWRGDIQWINKPIVPIKVSDVKFVSGAPDTGVRNGELQFKLEGYAGTAKILVDVDGDKEFTGDKDFTVDLPVKTGDNAYEYLGVDKDGNPVPDTQTVNFQIKLDKLAEIHFVNGDVEHRGGGLEINRLNGPIEGRDKISWDDTALEDNVAGRCSSADVLQANAVSSSGGKHGWKGMGETGEDNLDAACDPFTPNTATQGVTWGDARYIDDWANIQTNVVVDYSLPALLSSDLSLIKTVLDAPENIKNGDTVSYQVAVTNSGPDTVENVEVVDRPSEKLEYISNTASIGSFNPGELKWSIPKVEIDETVTLQLSFRVKDATPEITNLAEITASGNPDNDSTPNNCNGGSRVEDDCAVANLNMGKSIGAPKTGAIVGAVIVSVATLALAAYLMKEVYEKRETKLKSQK